MSSALGADHGLDHDGRADLVGGGPRPEHDRASSIAWAISTDARSSIPVMTKPRSCLCATPGTSLEHDRIHVFSIRHRARGRADGPNRLSTIGMPRSRSRSPLSSSERPHSVAVQPELQQAARRHNPRHVHRGPRSPRTKPARD